MISRILSAELKKRLRLNLFISILVPLFVLLIVGIGFAGNAIGDDIEQTWETLLLQLNMALLFFYPLGVTLICSHLANIEHQANSWKILLALPVKKEYTYYGKLIIAIGYSLITAFLLYVGVSFLGVSLGLSDNQETPWLLIFKQVFYPIIAAFSIISFQLCLSIFIRNQAFPIMIGVITSIFTYSLLIFPLTISEWLIWTYPTMASPLKPIFADGGFDGVEVTSHTEWYILLSLLVGAILSYLSAKRFSNQDVN